MPKSFDRCRKAGGKMRTISGPNKQFNIGKGKYLHVCIDKNGNLHRGYVKTKKGKD